ncbi:MAG: Type II secretion system F domain protein [Clostridia bacterium 41_269]|nr:MAG: Type II secretion system F domain protein [Clostridia bacterium 41_269]
MALYEIFVQDRMVVKHRIMEYVSKEVVEDAVKEELSKPLKERIFKPFIKKLSEVFERFLPRGSQENLREKLIMAGNPGNLSPNEFYTIRYTITFLFGIGAALAGRYFHFNIFRTGALFVLFAAVGYMLPELYLIRRKQRRALEIAKTLPDVLDLLTVSVEAGLGFDAALAKVVEKMDGIISIEFSRVLQEIRMGKPRREALRDLSRRTGAEDLNNFISSLIQADQLGVSIANVLRIQSREIRQKRRQMAEEKAMKAPVKMVIPLVLFIFPTVFIVVLGPALLRIFDVFLAR